MDSSLHRSISKNECTHRQGDHPLLSRFLKKFTIHTDTSDVQLGALRIKMFTDHKNLTYETL